MPNHLSFNSHGSYDAPIEMAYMEEWDVMGVFYDATNNRFVDEGGYWIDIFTLITPNDVLLFRQQPEYMMFIHRSLSNVIVEIYYSDD